MVFLFVLFYNTFSSSSVWQDDFQFPKPSFFLFLNYVKYLHCYDFSSSLRGMCCFFKSVDINQALCHHCAMSSSPL